HVEPSRQQRREADRAAGLDHQLQLAERERDRASGLLVGRRDPFADQLAVDLEGDLARRVRHQSVADRAGEARIVLVLAAPERACAFKASEMPAASPPPEAPITATSGVTPSAVRSSMISRPAVPWPAMMKG